MEPLRINDWLEIPAHSLQWTAARSSGPGGQNVNRVETKVDLRFDFETCETLSPAVRNRLRERAANQLDREGRIMAVAQETRSQAANLELARERVAEMVRASLEPPKVRRVTRPSRGSKERRLQAKRVRASVKTGRGRVNRDD